MNVNPSIIKLGKLAKLLVSFFPALVLTLLICHGNVKAQSSVFETAYGKDSIAGVKMEYFYLDAISEGELIQCLNEKMSELSSSGKHLAETSAKITWDWTGYGSKDCDLSTAQINKHITVTFPRWDIPDHIADEVVARWQTFIYKLAIHELGHIKISQEHADKIHSVVAGSNCLEADNLARAEFMVMENKHYNYDQSTHHGLLQGAVYKSNK